MTEAGFLYSQVPGNFLSIYLYLFLLFIYPLIYLFMYLCSVYLCIYLHSILIESIYKMSFQVFI